MKIISKHDKKNATSYKSETISTKNTVPKIKKKKSCLKDTNHDLLETSNKSSSDSDEMLTTPALAFESNEFIKYLQKNELEHFNNIYTACLTNEFEKLKQVFSSFTSKTQETQEDCGSGDTKTCNKLTATKLITKLLNIRMNEEKGYTLLHMASELGHADCVWLLLLYGSDPTIEDLTKFHAVPYSLGGNKATKDTFRRFMNDFPNRYKYESSKIPGPISEEQLNNKAEKEKVCVHEISSLVVILMILIPLNFKERKRNQKLKSKQRLNESKNAQLKEEQELEERRRFLSLTDDQKRSLVIDRNFLNISPLHMKKNVNIHMTKQQKDRLLIAEKREKFYQSKKLTDSAEISSAFKTTSQEMVCQNKDERELIKIIMRCWMCGLDMSTSIPFEYLDYKFCSSKCLKDHREKNKK